MFSNLIADRKSAHNRQSSPIFATNIVNSIENFPNSIKTLVLNLIETFSSVEYFKQQERSKRSLCSSQ